MGYCLRGTTGAALTYSDRFSGRLAAWLSMVGVAIGLGNVWRFPYMMGQHGGSAFLLVYAALTVLLAMPVLAAEWALGRALRVGPVPGFRAAFGRRAGLLIGSVLVVAIVIADSYYIVIIANIVFTALYGLGKGFGPHADAGLTAGLGNGGVQYGLAVLVLAAACWVMARGVREGIERISRWFVPAFGVVVLYLVVNALLLAGVGNKLLVFLRPDFALLSATDVFAAMGQAVFSLGAGGTIMLVYGGYLERDTPIVSTALLTALGDMSGALLAALFIVPSVLYFGLDMAAGPGLVFSTLPKLFALMPGGRWLGVAFLAAFVLMAFLSALAALEVGLVGLRDMVGGRWSRRRMALILFALEAVLMLPSALWPSIIGTLDLLFGSGMQTAGALAAVLALGWSASRKQAMAELFTAPVDRWQVGFVFWLRWVVPAALLVIALLFVREQLPVV